MKASIFSGILTKLGTDTTLLTLLDSPTDWTTTIFKRQRLEPIVLPSISVYSNERGGERYCGSFSAVKRLSGIDVDVWVSGAASSAPNTGEDAEAIQDRVDEILYRSAPVAGTFDWESGTVMGARYEDDTQIFHCTSHYTFEYFV